MGLGEGWETSGGEALELGLYKQDWLWGMGMERGTISGSRHRGRSRVEAQRSQGSGEEVGFSLPAPAATPMPVLGADLSETQSPSLGSSWHDGGSRIGMRCGQQAGKRQGAARLGVGGPWRQAEKEEMGTTESAGAGERPGVMAELGGRATGGTGLHHFWRVI